MKISVPNWIGGFFESKNTITEPRDILKEIMLQASTKSGIPINWKTALQSSVALACARVIAEGLAQVPYKLFKHRQQQRGADVQNEHPLYKLLTKRPNPWQTSYEFREQLGLHLAFYGNAFVFINRGVRGKVLELLVFEPQFVHVELLKNWKRKYTVHHDGNIIEVPEKNIIHLKGLTWDGVTGLEGVQLAREAIGLALGLENHSARMFSNGAKPGGILTTESTMTSEQIKALQEVWQAMQGGGDNAYKTAILSGGLKWQQMAMTGVDSQHLEQRRLQVEEVCRSFHVLPLMVGQSDKAATYASAEQMFLAHIVYTMMPWYTKVEQCMDNALLTKEEHEQGYYTKFVANGLMRGAPKDRSDYYVKMWNIGALSPNDIRVLEEMNPREDEEGDEYGPKQAPAPEEPNRDGVSDEPKKSDEDKED